MSYASKLVSSTPVKSDDSKKRDATSPLLDESIINPEKKNKLLTSQSDISDIQESAPVHLAESDFARISAMVNDAVLSQVKPLVTSIVSEVTKKLTERIDELTKEKDDLLQQVKKLSVRVEKAEQDIDTAEQYSRRNCLRIVGIKADSTENTDDVILDIASEIQADIHPKDLDRSHRVGQDPSWTTPKAIIVKFSTYRARDNFYRKRAALKGNLKYPGVYINEDLTSQRSKLFKTARQLLRNKAINSCWTYDGRVHIKDTHDVKRVINTSSDLDKYV